MAARRVMGLVILVLLGTGAARDASPAGPGDGLAGTTWHTVRIDGDALFFVVRDIGVRFEDGSRFTAAVRFIDGQQKSKTGTYRVLKPGTLLVTIDGLGKPKEMQVQRRGRDLIVRDRAFDVTVRLAPGKMEEEHWF